MCWTQSYQLLVASNRHCRWGVEGRCCSHCRTQDTRDMTIHPSPPAHLYSLCWSSGCICGWFWELWSQIRWEDLLGSQQETLLKDLLINILKENFKMIPGLSFNPKTLTELATPFDCLITMHSCSLKIIWLFHIYAQVEVYLGPLGADGWHEVDPAGVGLLLAAWLRHGAGVERSRGSQQLPGWHHPRLGHGTRKQLLVRSYS